MPIRKLPALLVNQIAAGEVIERPASVVKELVENSLDAGATRLDVAIEEGGRQLIRVSDNGSGIAHDELSLALEPHATSKLQTTEQLESIRTLGFRGEALASIASVSRARLISRATVSGQTSESGWCIEAAGEEVAPPMPIAASPGTIVEIRDLFFNTPARRKFMRGAPAEFGHISDLLTRIAMVHHHVSFTLSHNGRKVMDVPGNQTPKQRCLALLGNELEEAMVEFAVTEPASMGGASLWGLAGLPAIARATSKFQYLCVNGRPIRDRHLSHALKEAYRGLMPPEKQPVCVVFITMDPAQVDVNVHPAKSEVRFRDASRMHGLVLTTLRQRLLGTDLTPRAQLPLSDLRFGISDSQTDASDSAQSEITHLKSEISTPSIQTFVDYFRRMDPKQKGFAYEQVKQALGGDEDAQPTLPGGVAGEPVPAIRPASVRILQVHKSYLVTEDEHGIVIVDQHALHERVMFEELLKRVLDKDLESQRLLMPATLRLSASRLAALEQLQPLLRRLGIEAEPIGPQTIGIHAFASFLFERKVDPVEFMEELLDKAEEGLLDNVQPGERSRRSTRSAGDTIATQEADVMHESVLHEVLDMMACKAAVKAGDQMTHEELQALLDRKEQIERSSNCPHGRPTSIRLSLRELEKQFKRT